ncbi:MAG: 5-(carboxyamino)imidazole ribonucleotide mutase [Alphaproteobacteria bacterium]|jgi:5-(carboxyamino)imidazole ribonucleotide mutase
MSATEPKVAVLMGSANDWNIMQAACDQLTALGIANEARVISAHRTPQRHHDFVTEQAPAEGVKVFICGAGMAAHLAGVTAALTSSPVIGVPLESGGMGGMDSLLSTVQMPGGMPVATVAVGKAGAKNAAILAAQMLGLGHPEIAQRVKDLRAKQTAGVPEFPG